MRFVRPFQGLDPFEITALVYNPLTENSPLKLRDTLPAEELLEVSMMQFIRQFLVDVQAQQPLKLTQKGNLSRKFIHQMYDHRFFPSEHVDSGFSKLLQELDFSPLHIGHVISKFAGLVRKYNNKLSVTKKGVRALEDASVLYREILLAHTSKFNWSYLSYDPDDVVQLGWAYILHAFIKHGDKERNASFYAEKYLELFPEMLEQFPQNQYFPPERRFANCFQLRFFSKFCNFFGLADYRVEKDEKGFQKNLFVKKKPLADKVFVIG